MAPTLGWDCVCPRQKGCTEPPGKIVQKVDSGIGQKIDSGIGRKLVQELPENLIQKIKNPEFFGKRMWRREGVFRRVYIVIYVRWRPGARPKIWNYLGKAFHILNQHAAGS